MLFKLEPEVYRDQYIKATQAVIKLAISEDKQGEAEQLLDYLEQLGVDSGQLKPQKLLLASQSGDKSATAELMLGLLDSSDEADRLKGADMLVLARAPEAAQINQAISHLCRREWDQVAHSLRDVGRKSPFAHWRLFLRGCVAFYQNDAAAAQACFSRLPPETVPARKSQAYRTWQPNSGDWKNASASEIGEICKLHGFPGLADALMKSHAYWRKKNHIKAYEVLKRAKSGFPSLDVNLPGQLTRFFQFADLDLNGNELDHWISAVYDMSDKKYFSGPYDKYIFSNILTRVGGEFVSGSTWSVFIQAREKLFGKKPRFAAICHFTRALPALQVNCCEDCIKNARADAIEFLKTSIQTDPSYEEAHTQLLSSYQKLRMKSEANKLLDIMTKQFPSSKTVLLQAGRSCIDRKAYAKGLTYLQRAREADPLNTEIQAEIRRGLLEKTIGHYCRKPAAQLDKARETFEQLLDSISPNSAFGESREFIMLHGSVLEDKITSSPSLSAKRRAEADSIPRHVSEFFVTLYREIYGVNPSKRGSLRPPSLKLKGEKTPDQALQMIRIFSKILQSKIGDNLHYKWMDWLFEYISDAIRNLTKNERNIAVEMFQLMLKNFRRSSASLHLLIEKWRTLDDKDPLFACWNWTHSSRFPSPNELAETRKEAQARGDQLALKEIAEIEKQQKIEEEHFSNPGSIFDDEYDDDEYDDDELDEDELDEDEFDEDEDMDLDLDGSFMNIVEQLSSLSFSERVELLKKTGLPARDAKLLAESMDGISPTPELPQPKPTRAPRKPKSTPRPDPNQYDLPF